MTITPEIPWWLEKGDRGQRERHYGGQFGGWFRGGFEELLQRRRFSLELRKELEPEVRWERRD